MQKFSFSSAALSPERYREALTDPASGGYASFEGWVRDNNEGKRVLRLEYEAFEELGLKEGERIVEEAIRRFGVQKAACVHRVGDLITSSTRSSTACRSGRRSTTWTATRDG
jgi:molybdopterin synthase catalytic subunit